MKTCRKCNVLKQNCYFDRNADMPDGHINSCKACRLTEKKYREARKASLNVGEWLYKWRRV